MIFNAIVNFIVGVLNFIIALLPDADSGILDLITGTTEGFRHAMSSISWFFPVDTALLVLSAMFVIQAGVFLFKLIRYVAGVLSVGILK